MSINYGQISNACNVFCLVPNQKEKTGSTLRTKIKEDWITMLTFFCFLLLLPNPSLHPIQPQAPSYQASNPLTVLRAPSSRSLLADLSCLTYCPLPGSFLRPTLFTYKRDGPP